MSQGLQKVLSFLMNRKWKQNSVKSSGIHFPSLLRTMHLENWQSMELEHYFFNFQYTTWYHDVEY